MTELLGWLTHALQSCTLSTSAASGQGQLVHHLYRRTSECGVDPPNTVNLDIHGQSAGVTSRRPLTHGAWLSLYL